MEDGMQKDGLVDAYDKVAMGVCADACATEYEFSREDQDAFAIQSYNVLLKLGKMENLLMKLFLLKFLNDEENHILF